MSHYGIGMQTSLQPSYAQEEGTTQKIHSKGIKLTLTAELLQSMIQARELASQNKKNSKE